MAGFTSGHHHGTAFGPLLPEVLGIEFVAAAVRRSTNVSRSIISPGLMPAAVSRSYVVQSASSYSHFCHFVIVCDHPGIEIVIGKWSLLDVSESVRHMNLAANTLEQIDKSIADVPPVSGLIRVDDPLFKMTISLVSVVSPMK